MAKPKLTLYFDMHSPFAYLAFHLFRVCRGVSPFRSPEAADRHQQTSPIFRSCEITYVPILLVGLIHEIGGGAPWGIKSRQDCPRLPCSDDADPCP